MRKGNFYAIAKNILADGMRLDNWWKQPYDFEELRHHFGVRMLANGVRFSLDNGESVPDEILEICGMTIVAFMEEDLHGKNHWLVAREKKSSLHGYEFFNPDSGWSEYKVDARSYNSIESAEAQISLLQR